MTDSAADIEPLAAAFAHMARSTPGSEALLEGLAASFEHQAWRSSETADLLEAIAAEMQDEAEVYFRAVAFDVQCEGVAALHNAAALRRALRSLGNPAYQGH